MLLNVRALGAGVLVAVLLVGVQVWVDDFLNDAYMFVAPAEAARFAMSIAAIVSLQILLVCVPFWMVLSKFRMANWISAAVFGFVATMAYWLIRPRR